MPNGETRAFPEIAALEPVARGETEQGLEHVQNYLARFGYLEDTAAVRRGVIDDETSRALTRFQEFFGLPATGEFDAETRDMMTRPRCAMPDPVARVAFATMCPWQQQEITYAFDTGTADVPGTAEFQATRDAFATWAAVVPLTFREVGVGDAPDVRIGWRPANDPDLSMVGGTLAHADFPPGCSIVTNDLPKPVHFDDTEHTWSIGPVINAFDVETVALHEIGHILGLAHSSVAGAVMFPTIGSNTTQRALAQDDIAGVQSLYPLPAPPPPPPPPPPPSRCYIATAAYGSALAPEVQFLRGIRDGVLREMQWGRQFFENLERYYYRISPPIADEMRADPELRSIVRWAVVEPWVHYMRLLVARPDWNRVDMDALDPELRAFLTDVRRDMDAWLAGIEVPRSFAHLDPAEAVKELNAILTFVLRSGGIEYLDDLVAAGTLPLRHAPERTQELREALVAAGRSDAEIGRILLGTQEQAGGVAPESSSAQPSSQG